MKSRESPKQALSRDTRHDNAAAATSAVEVRRGLAGAGRRFAVTLAAARLVAWEWDPVRDRVVTSGPAAELFGLSAGTSLASVAHTLQLIHPDDRERHRALLEQASRELREYRNEFRVVRPSDGEVVWMEERGIALRHPATGRRRVVGVTWDITARKRAEEARRESDERYRALFDAIDQGFCVVEVLFDADDEAVDYRFVEINRAFEQQTGLTHVVGRRMRELVPAHEKHWFELYGRVARTGEPARFEARAEALGRWFEVNALRVGPASARRVAVLFRDITERKRSELNARFLSELEAHFVRLSNPQEILKLAAEKTAHHLGVARVSLTEIDEAAETLTVLEEYCEPGMPSGLGRRRIADYLGEVYINRLKDGHLVAVTDVVRDPHTFADAYRPRRIGSAIYAPYRSARGWEFVLAAQRREPHAWRADEIELLRELSARVWLRLERARAEAAVRESEARFRTLANGLPIMVWVADTEGRGDFANQTYLEFFGISADQAAEFDWRAVVHPEDRDAYVGAFVRALTSGQTLSARARVRRADGRWRWIESRGHPRLDLAGRVTGYIGCSTDITETWESQQALREADRRKDEFLATLAHELRNPLAPIRQAASIAKSPDASEAQVRWSHDVIERQVQHMSLLLDDLLDISRITRGKLTLRREWIDVRTVIDAAVEGARPFIDARRHQLHIDSGSAGLRLEADPLRLAQVFTNLLTNAAKYTDPGGRIGVAVRCEHDSAVIEVTDNGIGVPTQALPRMFEMFAQVQPALDRAGGGLGIGLALSKGLVELHRGTIAVHSEGPGRGSTFTVRLPGARAEAAAAGARTLPVGASAATPRRRILIVDDNRDAADTLAALVELDGHEVRTAHDGLQALALGASFEPDCMLLDIGMPGLNGYEVAQRLRQTDWGGGLTLIATTGWGQREDRERALALGFDHHLTKPIDPHTLQALLNASSPRLQ